MHNIEISFIVPTLNEKENILKLHKLIINSVYKKQYTYNIIFVDDQSNDGTIEEVNKLIQGNANIKIIQNKINKGLGYALLSGVNVSTSKYIIFLDCDVSIRKKDLQKILDNRKQNCMLIGSRYIENSKINGANKFKVLVSKFLNSLISLIYKLEISDVSHSLRIFPNNLDYKEIKTLSHPGFFWELTILFKKKGTIKEIPITFNERMHGFTKNKSWKLIKSIMKFFFNQITN